MRKKRSSCLDNRIAGAQLALAAISSLAIADLGCTTACDTNPNSNPPQVVSSGVASGGVYESSPSTGGLIPFPGGKQFYLEHHLGFTPTFPLIYVGFDANGDDLAPCAGNTCVIPCVNSEIIWIRNDTCADFLLRVVTTGRSTDQSGTLCPGGAFISIAGSAEAGSADASAPPPEASPSLEAATSLEAAAE
jgi:hypothetical protein